MLEQPGSSEVPGGTKVIDHFDESPIFLDYSIHLDDDVDTVVMYVLPTSE